jgi:hypothetical protein
MNFYSLTDRDVLTMPLKRFWLLSGNVNRIQAEQDMRRMFTNAAAQTGEGLKDYSAKLREEIGNIARPEREGGDEWVSEAPEAIVPPDDQKESNRAGFAELKALAAF